MIFNIESHICQLIISLSKNQFNIQFICLFFRIRLPFNITMKFHRKKKKFKRICKTKKKKQTQRHKMKKKKEVNKQQHQQIKRKQKVSGTKRESLSYHRQYFCLTRIHMQFRHVFLLS